MNNNESFELEEMRQQMAVLKKKLEQQEIINERMASKTRKSVEKFMDRFNKECKFDWIMALLFIPLNYYFFVNRLGFSIPFWIISCLYSPIRLYFRKKEKSSFPEKGLHGDNLIEAQKNLIMAKKSHRQWFKYDLALNTAFPACLAWEIYQKYLWWGFFPIYKWLIVGVIAGFGLFLLDFFLRQRKYKEILEQIDDLTSNVEKE